MHWFLEASQNSPVVAASQSVVPHAQFAGLAAVPSVVVQTGTVLHRYLFDVRQKSPVVAVQILSTSLLLRHRQFSMLAVRPSVLAQYGTLRHCPNLQEGTSQKSPVICLSQTLFAQTQLVGLAVMPPVLVQRGKSGRLTALHLLCPVRCVVKPCGQAVHELQPMLELASSRSDLNVPAGHLRHSRPMSPVCGNSTFSHWSLAPKATSSTQRSIPSIVSFRHPSAHPLTPSTHLFFGL